MIEKPSIDELQSIWNTSTLDSFNKLNFNDILYPSNIDGNETYIKLSQDKNADVVNGFRLLKKHKNDNVETLYFVRTIDINDLPIEILNTKKINYSKEVFNLVIKNRKCRITPERIFTWKQIVDWSGCPQHTNSIHYSLYKMKCLYGRTKDQFYYRVISESAFGKTKYKEMLKLLLNKMTIVSDPSSPKLFFSICHNIDVTLNEMPDTSNKGLFIKFCNMLMNLGDKSKSIENPSRKTEGTFENADTSKLSLSFTHNPPYYYQEKGLKSFEEIFPYNVVNRYYYNFYDGQTIFHQKNNYNSEKIALKFQTFLRDWIKSVLWYEEHWNEIENKFPSSLIDGFKFKKQEPRFKEHFRDFAKCISEYCGDDLNLYMKLLVEEYKSHKNYEQMIKKDNTEIKTNEMNMKDKREV